MKPRRIVKNSPEPIRISTASEKLPITGIAAYRDMLVGNPQRKSETGVTNLKTLFTLSKIFSIFSLRPMQDRADPACSGTFVFIMIADII